MISIENKSGKLILLDDMLVFVNGITEKTTVFSRGDEFVLYVENSKGEICALSEKYFQKTNTETQANNVKYSYQGQDEYSKIAVTVTYTAKADVFEKRVAISFGEEMLLKRVCLENRTVSASVNRGGEGQPVFIEGENVAAMWCGIEYPVANNGYENETLCFMQAPFEKTESFLSLPVVYGLDDCGNLLDSFSKYIKTKTLKKSSMRIYCDWGMHDELAEGGPVLTEKMTLDAIADIQKITEKTGVKFDYYLMDAFWFKTNQFYREFKDDTFPNGPQSVVDALKKAGIKFGLWFDVNCKHAHLEGMEEYDAKLGGGELCISDESIVNRFREGIEKQIRECGIKMIKLDFAFFECFNPNHGHSTDLLESKEKSVKNFIKMLADLREIEPELQVLCYNGWTTSLDWIGSIKKREGYAVSPYWSQYIDYVYCGDPRPSEIVSENMEDSLVYYTDAMYRYFADSAFPLDCIDDHGTMCGDTSTVYYLGNRPFRESVLMNVMRGSKIHLYGDISWFKDEDYAYFQYVNKVYDTIIRNGYTTRFIAGNACKGELYGYEKDGGTEGYVVLVNPTPIKQTYVLQLPQWANARVYAAVTLENGRLQKGKQQEVFGAMPLEISAHGYVLIEWKIGPLEKISDRTLMLVGEKLTLKAEGNRSLQLTFTKDGKPLRTGRGCPFGLKVLADGVEVKQNVAQDVWSGISWASYTLNGARSVTVVNDSDTAFTLKYTLVKEDNT